jgi:hypothetical protein
VIDAGAFRTARGSASGGIGRSTRLLAVRSRRFAACTERERHCTEGGGHCHAGLSASAGPFLPHDPGLARSTRSAAGRKNMRLIGEQCAIVAVVYSAFVAELRTGIANVTLALVDRSTPRLPGLQSCFETSVA